VEASVAARKSYGGTAPERVGEQLEKAKALLAT
jgi:argininosuccinate lyase